MTAFLLLGYGRGGLMSSALWSDSVDAIIAPASACGGPAVLSLLSPKSQRKTILLVSQP